MTFRYDKMFSEADLRDFKLITETPQNYKDFKIPAFERWLILYGCFYHVNGSDSVFYILDKTGNNILHKSLVGSANTTGWYPIWNTVAGVTCAQQPPLLPLEEGMILRMGSAADGAFFVIKYFRWIVGLIPTEEEKQKFNDARTKKPEVGPGLAGIALLASLT